ncbi:hypothetical protein LY78DRAFT_664370 [Colletotrichum sublineola]|nr:hypothetical protein LY78DRAFT_664370 [Colletotrichum sublineola]
MRVTSIAVVALLTGAVIAGKQLRNGDCHGATLDKMSRDAVNNCATHYDPTANYPVWDESEDFSCRMCPPKKELLKLKRKQMTKNPQKSLSRNGHVQGRGIIKAAFECIDCLVSSACDCACGIALAAVCCPCLTYALIEKCIAECT